MEPFDLGTAGASNVAAGIFGLSLGQVGLWVAVFVLFLRVWRLERKSQRRP